MEDRAGSASTFVDLVRVAGRNRLIILIALVLVPLVAVVHAVRQPNVYSSSAQVLLTPQAAAVRYAGGPSMSPEDPARYAATQTFLARSPSVAKGVVERARIPGLTVGGFLGASGVTAAADANLLTFSATSGNPRLAQRLADLYAAEFTNYRRGLDTRALSSAIAELNLRLRRLGPAEQTLKSTLLDRIQSLQTTEALQRQSTYVARPAGAAMKVAPRPRRDGLIGVALGLILGVGLAFLREALDTRLRTADDIARRLGLPLLAQLSTPPKHLRASNRLVMMEEPYTPAGEMFRMLRTSIDLANLDRQARTLMITSAIASEGKTTTAANLGVALAVTGRHAILVDLDLRRPAVHRFFGLKGRPGLTDVALNDVALKDAIACIELDGVRSGGSLSILPSGPIPPDPGEFVGTSAVGVLLADLAERYDVVLIDTPPVLQAVEAMTLSTHVDAMLVVTRLETARRGMITELQRMIDRTPAAKLGFILTGTESGGSGYGYDYAYPYALDDLVS